MVKSKVPGHAPARYLLRRVFRLLPYFRERFQPEFIGAQASPKNIGKITNMDYSE
jgi:hypothetical protein